MPVIQIDQATCNQCGLCAAECPEHLIELKDGKYPQPIALADVACIDCGHCVAICPTGSLSQRAAPGAKAPVIQAALKVSPEQCDQLLKSRRSVRIFKKDPVPRDVIARLIETARYAPTGHNNQEVEWLVIDSRKELDKIEELGIGWINWTIQNQPQLAAMFNMPQLLKDQQAKHNVFLRGAPVLVVTHAVKEQALAMTDSATALGYLDLAANTQGLGTCWAGFVYIMANAFPPVKAAIALPEGHVAYGCMMLGYNQHKFSRIPARREPKITWR